MLLRIILVLLAGPWIIAAVFVRACFALVRLPGRLGAGVAVSVGCPVGHPNALHGRWTCGCGAMYLGHAFAPCPVCGLPAGWMRCETCGLAIRSPWKDG